MNKHIIAEMQKHNWIMEPKALSAFFGRLIAMTTEMPDIEILTAAKQMIIRNKTAVINITGILMNKIPGWFKWFGIEATSYEDIRNQIDSALNNKDVDSIFFNIDSPGGVVAGGIETMEAIAAASGKKKTSAHIQDLGASGAYFLASQAGSITAGPNAAVGSLGVFTVYEDLTKMAEQMGIKVIVIKSGEHKGMGIPGAAITDSQIATVQEIVDGIAANFIAMVAKGRKLDKDRVKELATGRLWLAGETVKLGLVDKVVNMNASNNNNSKGNTMAEEKTEQKTEVVQDVAAADVRTEKTGDNIKEFKEAFGDDPAFALEQIEKGRTIEQAKAEYCEVLKKRLKEKKENKQPAGAQPVEHNEAADGDGDFMELSKARAEEKKIKMSEAMKQITRENPEAYSYYIEKCKGKGKKKGK